MFTKNFHQVSTLTYNLFSLLSNYIIFNKSAMKICRKFSEIFKMRNMNYEYMYISKKKEW